MTMRQRMGLGVSPLFLRLALAVTFIWAGLGKFMATDTVHGENAAVLANLGVVQPPLGGFDMPLDGDGGLGDAVEEFTPSDGPGDEVGEPEPESENPDEGGSPDTDPGLTPLAMTSMHVMRVADDAGMYTAEDFPAPGVSVRRMFMLSVLLHNAANPAVSEDGGSRPAIWPEPLAQDQWPVWMAWAVVVAELGGGAVLLLGLLTRLWSLVLAGTMAGAMWLTQIGPAVQRSETFLGFLPAYERFDTASWTPLMWQFALLMMAMAVLFAGPGMLAMDNKVLPGSRSAGGGYGSDDD